MKLSEKISKLLDNLYDSVKDRLAEYELVEGEDDADTDEEAE